MADKDVTTKLTLQGDSSGLISAMQKAEAQIATFEGNIARVSGTIGKLTGIMGVIAGVLAGGAMFKDVVNETNKWTGEAMKLSRMLGITTQEASVLNLALGDVYLSMDTMTAASMALNKNTLKNSEVFTHYGIALKDSNGHQRNTLEIMNDVNAKLLTIKEGRDRELAGLQLYGKGWAEARGMLKLTADVMEEAKRKAEELHLIVGPEAVANTKAYKAAMNDVEDVWMALKIQVGNQIIPLLTRLGVWFNDIGPAGLEMFIGALKGVMTFGQYAALGLVILYESAKAGVNQIITLALTTNDVLAKVLAGDFKGAAASAKSGWKEMADEGDKWADRVIAATNRTNDSVLKMWGFKPTKAGKGKPDAPETSGVDLYDKDGKDKTSSAIAAEQAMLAAILAGFKAREASQKEYATTSNLEWEYFYRTGVMGELEYQEKKFQIERMALKNTQALVDDEIAAIEASLQKKLALEADPSKQEKLRQEAKKETTEKTSEREKLNQELYRLDVKHETDVDVLEQERLARLRNSGVVWGQQYKNNLKEELLQTREFEDTLAELRGDSFQKQFNQLDQERQELERSWAMNTDSFEVYEQRKRAIAAMTAEKRRQLEQQTTVQNIQQYGLYASNASTLANNLYNLMGKKNRDMFNVAKGVSLASTAINTAEAVMKAYAQTGIFGGPIAAAIVGAVGASQMALIAAQQPDGASSAASNASGSGTFTYPGASPVTQPITSLPASQAPVINIVLNGTTLADPQALTRWSEDYLMPTIRDLTTRGVTA